LPGDGRTTEGKPQRRGVLGLHRVEQSTCPHRLHESGGAAQPFFKRIFFMEGSKKSHVTLLLKTYEALIQMEAKTRASQEPPVRGDLTGWQESKGYKIKVYEPWIKAV